MVRVLLVGLLVLSAGCGASISRSAHEAALDQERTRYEALLAQARRREGAAEDGRAACLATATEAAQVDARRFARLERTLAEKEVRLMTLEASGAPASAALSPRAFEAAATRLGARALPEGGRLRLVIPERALFVEGEATLLPGAGAGLDALAEALVGASARVRVEGHTDVARAQAPGGPVLDDWAQAGALAAAVARALQARGVDPSRLGAAAYGAHRPPAEGGARRVEVLIWVGPGA
jgi:flagellar motor protein MotB